MWFPECTFRHSFHALVDVLITFFWQFKLRSKKKVKNKKSKLKRPLGYIFV